MLNTYQINQTTSHKTVIEHDARQAYQQSQQESFIVRYAYASDEAQKLYGHAPVYVEKEYKYPDHSEHYRDHWRETGYWKTTEHPVRVVQVIPVDKEYAIFELQFKK